MALIALGLIEVVNAGTPVPCVSEYTPCNSFFIQVNANNTGAIYVGNVDMDPSTLEGVFAVLPAPDTTLPAFNAGIVLSANGINLADIYLDSDEDGDSGLVSYAQL